jgi:Mg2+ and Co2+ transporter CorA
LSRENKSARASENEDQQALPRSLSLAREDPRRDLRRIVESVLSDKFMGFVALLLVPIIVLPLITTLPESVTSFLYVSDWTIILIFVFEYSSKLYLSKSRREYFRSRWHLLDLSIIALSILLYLPFFDYRSPGSPSLLLRLLRLPRLFVAGGRAIGGVVPETTSVLDHEANEKEAWIRSISAEGSAAVKDGLSWEEFKEHLATDEHEWLDVHNVPDKGFSQLSQILQVSEPHFKSSLMDELYPHIDYVQRSSFIFLQSGQLRYPDEENRHLRISRSGFIIICSGSKIISISRHEVDLFRKTLESVRGGPAHHTFVVSVLYEILDSLLTQYRLILSDIEIDVSRIGQAPRSMLPRDFLERIYTMKREVSRLTSNLVHFKSLLGVVMTRKITLEGFDTAAEDDFEVLQDGTSYLTEIAEDLNENLKSVIELYINQTGFETNRILKILAVITSVGVIPASVGSLLGMNLLGTPYEAYLWQVTAIVVVSMVFAVYVFVKLGWLKT